MVFFCATDELTRTWGDAAHWRAAIGERGGALACAHTRKQAGRARGTTVLHRAREVSSLVRRRSRVRRRLQPAQRGARPRQARVLRFLSQRASAVAALLRTCASQPRVAQGRSVAPRPCTERESPVASAAAF